MPSRRSFAALAITVAAAGCSAAPVREPVRSAPTPAPDATPVAESPPDAAVAAPHVYPPPVPATTEPALPEGVVLDEVVVPTGPGFTELPERWWKKKRPCPEGSEPHRSTTSVACRDAKDRDHGPVVILSDTDQPLIETWMRHGVKHGVQRRWDDGGRPTEQVTFVDGIPQGPSTTWVVDVVVATGDNLAGMRHGLWTHRDGDGLTVRGHFDAGLPVGTWIGTRDEVATALVVARFDRGWIDGELRIYDEAGALRYERIGEGTTGTLTAWAGDGTPLASYDCGGPYGGSLTEARFHDDRGALVARWKNDVLVDAHGAVVVDTEKAELVGYRASDACMRELWTATMVPGRDTAMDMLAR